MAVAVETKAASRGSRFPLLWLVFSAGVAVMGLEMTGVQDVVHGRAVNARDDVLTVTQSLKRCTHPLSFAGSHEHSPDFILGQGLDEHLWHMRRLDSFEDVVFGVVFFL